MKIYAHMMAGIRQLDATCPACGEGLVLLPTLSTPVKHRCPSEGCSWSPDQPRKPRPRRSGPLRNKK